MTTVREYLTLVSGLLRTTNGRRGQALRTHCYEQLVLDHGQTWTPAAKPADVAWGPLGECFKNAGLLAMERADLTYVEGWAFRYIPVHHAWCVTASGAVVDPTWKPDAKLDRLLADGQAPAVEYVGIPFQQTYLLKARATNKVWGLFYASERLLTDDPATFKATLEVTS